MQFSGRINTILRQCLAFLTVSTTNKHRLNILNHCIYSHKFMHKFEFFTHNAHMEIG